MADDTTPEPQVPTTPTEPAAQPAHEPQSPAVDVRALPEFKAALTEEVERVFSERLERERGKIRKSLQRELRASSPEPTTEPEENEPATPPNGQGRRSKTDKRLDFRDAVADYGFDRKMRSRLERTYLAEGGDDDVDGWLEDYVETFQLGKRNTASPQPQATAAAAPAAPTPKPPQDPPGPTASDRGGVTAANNTFTIEDPERWTSDHVNRLRAEASEANQPAGRYIRQKFLEGLRGKTLIVGK